MGCVWLRRGMPSKDHCYEQTAMNRWTCGPQVFLLGPNPYGTDAEAKAAVAGDRRLEVGAVAGAKWLWLGFGTLVLRYF